MKLLHAKNESHAQPILNLALARAYATAHDPKMATRTWRDVMAEMSSHGKRIHAAAVQTRHEQQEPRPHPGQDASCHYQR